MKSISFSMVPMEKQDKGWEKFNGSESGWCWIQIQEDNGGSGFGTTMMGPYRIEDGESYIERIKQTIRDRDMGFWRRLYSVLLR